MITEKISIGRAVSVNIPNVSLLQHFSMDSMFGSLIRGTNNGNCLIKNKLEIFNHK